MFRWVVCGLVLCFSLLVCAQVETLPSSGKEPGPSQQPPRSDPAGDQSSSRDTRIDISPPKDDQKKHPNSSSALNDAEDASNEAPGDVQEFHPWNPHKAAKDIEVGDFYFKRKNYRAALDRYREALYWKDKDAVANFRVGQCLEKLEKPDEALPYYQAYLQILPDGPMAAEAHKAVDRLKPVQEETPDSEKK